MGLDCIDKIKHKIKLKMKKFVLNKKRAKNVKCIFRKNKINKCSN